MKASVLLPIASTTVSKSLRWSGVLGLGLEVMVMVMVRVRVRVRVRRHAPLSRIARELPLSRPNPYP